MEILLQHSNKPDPIENSKRRMRWFYAVFIAFWTLAAITAPVVSFCLTKSPLSFTLFSTVAPPTFLWYLFAKHAFPMDEKTYELKKLRIQTKGRKYKNL